MTDIDPERGLVVPLPLTDKERNTIVFALKILRNKVFENFIDKVRNNVPPDSLCTFEEISNLEANMAVFGKATPSEAIEKLKTLGLTFGDCVRAFGVADSHPLVQRAQQIHKDESDDISFDDYALLSQGDNPNEGFVSAWVWAKLYPGDEGYEPYEDEDEEELDDEDDFDEEE